MANNELNLQKPPTSYEKITEVADMLRKSRGRIDALLRQSGLTPDRLFAIMRSVLAGNVRLAQCHAASICGAVMQATMLGLEPNTPLGQCFLVAFWNKKANAGRGGYEAQLIIGATGKVQLLTRSGYVAGCKAKAVCANDEFAFVDGLDPEIRHITPTRGERGDIIGFWGGIKLTTGFERIEYMSKEEMEAHRDRFALSKDRTGKVFGPWVEHFAAMGVKTMIHKIAKHAPMSPTVAHAWNLDTQAEKGIPQQFSTEIPPDMWQVGAIDEPREEEHPEEAMAGDPVGEKKDEEDLT